MIKVCAWCKRETVHGAAVGAPMSGAKYDQASHGICVGCAETFDARGNVVAERLAEATAASASVKR